MNQLPDEQAGAKQGGVDLGMILIAALCVLLMVLFWHRGWRLAFLVAETAVISIVLWQACDPFAETAQWVGKALHLPGSVRGATLDAVASSMPELLIGILFVVVALVAAGGNASAVPKACGEGYASTIATCAGSAIYNMIVIPAVCAIVIAFSRRARPRIDVERRVLSRDGVFYVLCVALLLGFLYYNQLTWWMALVFLALYGVYILVLGCDARAYRLRHGAQEPDPEARKSTEDARLLFGLWRVPLNGKTAGLVILGSTAVAAAACYFLVEAVLDTARLLDVPAFFVAVILAAAASSVPDTFLSIGASRRGDDSGAVSNAFGSNIFDICVCLSIPLLISCYLNNWQPIKLVEDGKPLVGLLGLQTLLWVLSLITLGIIWHKRQVTLPKAVILLGLYAVFITYAVLGSLKITVWGFSL